MDVNADFDERVVLHGDEIEWRDSPMAGVSRQMLDRIGDEVARATSIVRYAPGSHFSPHVHTGGEEFLVLDGVFQDEHGDFPAGAYIRNPPESRHTPGSDEGCVILVKLWQFDMTDRTHVRIDTNKMAAVADRTRPGVAVTPLFADGQETVRLEYWDAGTAIDVDTEGGAELFVLAGGFVDGDEALRVHSWLRVPIGGDVNAVAGPDGATVWIKSGHLGAAKAPAT